MTAKRKSMRARSAPQQLPAPTERQIGVALLAFEEAKRKYSIYRNGPLFIVEVRPINNCGPVPSIADVNFRHFNEEREARDWRDREIMREVITAGMRAAP